MNTARNNSLWRNLAAVLLLLVFGPEVIAQQTPASPPNDIDTTWLGVHYQVMQLQKIAGDRLLVMLRLYGTPKVPSSGTFIGVQVPVPPGTTPAMIATGIFRPRAFSIASATMTDDQTHQTYATLAPSPSGPRYLPDKVMITLHANESQIMTLQFPLPPPLPPGTSTDNLPHTVSLNLPNATAPIKGLILPSPSAPPNP